MFRENNKAACRRFIQQIFNEGNLSSVRDFVAADAVNHELGDVDVAAGRSPEWFADSLDFYRVAFPDLRVEIQDQIAETDRVVTRLRMQGTQKGPLLGIGASGKKVDIQGIRVDRMAEGKIVETWLHWDSLGMLQQIGALPNLNRSPADVKWATETTVLPALRRIPFVPPQTRQPSAEWNPAA